MTAGRSINLLERVFKLFSVRARPVAESTAAEASPMQGLLVSDQLKEPENHFRTCPSRIMLALGVNHGDCPICIELHCRDVSLHGAPQMASASVSTSAGAACDSASKPTSSHTEPW